MSGRSAMCLYGAGGHGRVVSSQARRYLGADVCFGDASLAVGTSLTGVIVRFREIEEVETSAVIVTIGDNATRKRLQQAAERSGIDLASVVMVPDTWFADDPRPGVQVLAGAIVNIGAVIGVGTIINSTAVVEHDSRIGDFCHVAPGGVVGGGARLGEGVLVGTNASILPGVSVAPWSVIGAGAVVVRNIEKPGVFMGVPARRSDIAGRELM